MQGTDDISHIDADQLIVKSNDLINGIFPNMSIWAWRVFSVCCSLINPSDEQLRMYKLRVADIARCFGATGNAAHDAIKQVPEEMLRDDRRVRIPFYENGVRKYVVTHLAISYIEQEKGTRGDGCITIQFHPALERHLLGLKKHFTSYKLDSNLRFKSVYTGRLFELLKQHAYIGTWKVSFDELTKLLDVPKSYKWGNVNQRILVPSQLHIGRYTDINFDYKPVKAGQKVVQVLFTIKSQETTQSLADKPSTKVKPPKMPKILEKWGLSQQAFEQLVEQYGIKKVKERLKHMKSLSSFDQIINKAGYLTSLCSIEHITPPRGKDIGPQSGISETQRKSMDAFRKAIKAISEDVRLPDWLEEAKTIAINQKIYSNMYPVDVEFRQNVKFQRIVLNVAKNNFDSAE